MRTTAMEQRLTATTPTMSVAALMFAKDPSPAPEMVHARLMNTAPKRFPPSGTTALWATAVWGTKPAPNRNMPLEFPPVWDSNVARTLRTRGCGAWTSALNAGTSTSLTEAFKTALYGDNLKCGDRYIAG